ncbi:MAG: hypothetical protein U0V56_02540 [Actinomycetota bacterium]
MHVFAIALLFGLGIMVLGKLVERFIMGIPELHTVLLVGLGIGLAWAVNFDIFADWGLAARAGWVGVTMTGIILGGIAYAWGVVFGLFSGVLRKVNDEAATMEQTQGLRAA